MVRASLFLGLTVLLAHFVPAGGPEIAAGQPSITWHFEEESDLEGWQTTSGALRWAPGRGVNGSAAAAVSPDGGVGQGRTGHPVSIRPGGSYRLSGTLTGVEGGFESVWLKLSVSEPGGPEVMMLSAGKLHGPGTWSRKTAPVPCEAAEGAVVLVVSGDPGSAAYVDDLRLELVDVAPCPTPTVPPPPPPPPSPLPVEPTPPPGGASPAPPPAGGPDLPGPGGPASAQPAPSRGLVINGGFEASEGGVPIGWRTQGGVLAQVDSPVHGGRFAGGFASNTTSTKWVYQAVPVTPTAWYVLDGYVRDNDPRVEVAFLRVSWYASGDGRGRAVAQVDSTSALEEPEARYRRLTTGPVQAPPGVHSAKVRIMLRPRSSASAIIYIDDVSFHASAPAPWGDGGEDGGTGGAAGSGSRRLGGAGRYSGVKGESGMVSAPGTPLPSPVIVRSAPLRVEAGALEPGGGGGTRRWLWAAAGGAGAMGLAAWGAWRWRQERRAG